jgi:hypothetical protein
MLKHSYTISELRVIELCAAVAQMREADPLTEHVVAMELEHLKQEVSAEFASKMDLEGCMGWLLSRKPAVNRNEFAAKKK